MRAAPRHVPGDTLPADLRQTIVAAGYYPALVADVVGAAVAGDAVTAHMVHQETTFDEDSVRRHVTVLVLTESRLVVVHADDHDEHDATKAVATATSEVVPLSSVRGVMVTHVVASPEAYRPGSLGREVTLTLGWGAVGRLDLVPAGCGDPGCDADHGFDGTLAADDISLRVSADADGQEALTRAMHFATTLSTAIGR